MKKRRNSKRQPLCLIPVEIIPRKTTKNYPIHDILGSLDAFMDMDCKIVKISMSNGEFLSPDMCYKAMHNGVKEHNYPINVVTRMGGGIPG